MQTTRTTFGPDGQVVSVQPLTVPDDVANGADLRTKAAAALDANATYLALSNPTNAQNAAQVQRLTRECSGLIRLLLGRLEDTAGT